MTARGRKTEDGLIRLTEEEAGIESGAGSDATGKSKELQASTT